MQLERLTVRGFKSIRALDDFPLRSLNVLIGANGAGKSNFVELFRMLGEMMAGRLQVYVAHQGGADALMHGGVKRTRALEARFHFNKNGYEFVLAPAGHGLVFTSEVTTFEGDRWHARPHALGAGHVEARLPTAFDDTYAEYVRRAITSWMLYHFHDTSATAGFRLAQPVRDNLRLKANGDNLAPFLRRLHDEHSSAYAHIMETVRLAAPFLGDFVHRDIPGERIDLEWFEAHDTETPRGPGQLSDGTLRFIALATALLQPEALQPATIVIDEPELGLHPYAIGLLAALLRRASATRKIVVATQSVELVNELAPEDVVVVSREQGASVFQRLEAEPLREWLQDYALGEMWKMNVIGGRPRG